MTWARSFLRAGMTALRAAGLVLLLVLISPLLLLAALHAVWRRLDLWAFYDGDEAKRQKAEWRDGRYP